MSADLLQRVSRRLDRLMMGRKAYKWVVRDWLKGNDLAAAADVLGTMRFTRQIEPQPLDGPRAREIVVVAPHPDDEVIGPGGTLIRMARLGKKVTVLFVSAGTAQERDTRETEAKICCDTCGFEARFVGEAAGAIDTIRAGRAIAALIAEKTPEAIFIPFLLDDHDDHRRVNAAFLAGLSGAGLPRATEIWAYQVYTPLPGNVVVDITDVADAKADAIRGYGSQMQRRDWAHFALGLNAFNCRLLAGCRDRRYAESFFVVRLTEYLELCRRYFGSGAT